jgi:hypothetical protein
MTPRTASPLGQVLLRLLLVEGDALGLVAGDAVEPPGEQRHPFCEHQFQVTLRL